MLVESAKKMLDTSRPFVGARLFLFHVPFWRAGGVIYSKEKGPCRATATTSRRALKDFLFSVKGFRWFLRLIYFKKLSWGCGAFLTEKTAMPGNSNNLTEGFEGFPVIFGRFPVISRGSNDE